MTQIVLQTKKLTKKFDDFLAVDNISMTIQKGDIYGLIGRNGAGKTTLMRMITSLSNPTSGEITLLGKEKEKLHEARTQIGSIIETPAFFNNMTAKQNLEYYRILRGVSDGSHIKEVLKVVNLEDTGNKKFKNFSLGMKQRLGLALALLNKPDFLILDEPTNGLDPIAIVEMRDTLKKLVDEYQMTILVSSHILSELAHIATRYGIIHKGKMVKQLTSEELAIECQNCVVIKTKNPEKACQILETNLKTTNYKLTSKNEIKLFDHIGNIAIVNNILVKNEVEVYSIYESGITLEEYFIQVTKEVK